MAGRHQHRASGHGHRIDNDDVCGRRQTAVAVLALAVADERRAVFEREMHIRNAGLTGALNAVAVEIGEHLADDAGLGRKHTAGHQHLCASRS